MGLDERVGGRLACDLASRGLANGSVDALG